MAATANKGGRAATSSRGDLVGQIAEQCGLTQLKAEEVTRAYEDAIKKVLAGGGEVRLTGFGSFKLSHRKARMGRNPRTGASQPIAAQTVPRFTPGKQFKEQVGGPKGGAAKGGAAKGGAAKSGAAKGGATKAGAAKAGAAKAGAAKSGAAKSGAATSGAATSGAAAGAATGAAKSGAASKGGAAKGGASKGGSKGGASKK